MLVAAPHVCHVLFVQGCHSCSQHPYPIANWNCSDRCLAGAVLLSLLFASLGSIHATADMALCPWGTTQLPCSLLPWPTPTQPPKHQHRWKTCSRHAKKTGLQRYTIKYTLCARPVQPTAVRTSTWRKDRYLPAAALAKPQHPVSTATHRCMTASHHLECYFSTLRLLSRLSLYACTQ